MKRTFVIGLIGGVALGASIAALGQDKPSTAAFAKIMEEMMPHMHMAMTGDADKDFAAMMGPHFQAAIDMAKVELTHGKDPEMRELAERIISGYEKEVRLIYDWQIRAQADDHH
jgi:uncharacterized protein (DUF305 family)